MGDTSVQVSCEPQGGGWRCRVTVGDDAAATEHDVAVGEQDVERYAPGTDPERLVDASFEFLLEREPRESILARFELPVISRYFPEYEGEIRRRLGS